MEENNQLLSSQGEPFFREKEEKKGFDYTGLDTTSPERFEGETYQEYKFRQKAVYYVMKKRLKGTLIHQSRTNTGIGITYFKSKEING